MLAHSFGSARRSKRAAVLPSLVHHAAGATETDAMIGDFKHHAFISDAWVDSEIPVYNDLGWVGIFVDRLR